MQRAFPNALAEFALVARQARLGKQLYHLVLEFLTHQVVAGQADQSEFS
jgi:hypothetical protein